MFPCHHCGAIFQTKLSRRYHKESSHKVVRYPCTVCNKYFLMKAVLEDHLEVHRNERSYKCAQCSSSFFSRGQLKVHARRIHDKKLTCSLCPKKFASSGALAEHMRRHVGEKPYKCDQCGKEFASKNNLNNHKIVHTKGKPHQCSKCQFRCRREYELKLHFNVRHITNRPLLGCQKCDKTFISKVALRQHVKRKHGSNPLPIYLCLFCESSFHSNNHLERHINLHTKETPFSCELCGKEFHAVSARNCHIRRFHTNERPYTCIICKKGFAHNGNMKKHLLTHMSQRSSYKCNDCGRSFRSFLHKDSLDKHKKVMHSGAPPTYQCKQCDKVFPTVQKFFAHQGVHARENLIVAYCLFCNDQENFRKQEGLLKHMSKHTGEKLYFCKFCNSEFSQQGHCYDHMRRRHAIY